MILVNGKQTDVLPVADRGLQYGDGVWETVLIKQGQAILLDKHLKRLQQGLMSLGITSLAVNDLQDDIDTILRTAQDAILKIIVTRGAGGRGYNPVGVDTATRIVSLHPVPQFPEHYQQQGIKLTSCHTRLSYNPKLAGFKHLNRLEQIMARSEFDDTYQEGLVRDYNDCVIEGTMSNLFLIKDNMLTTPALDGCGIRGIMQATVMEQVRNQGDSVDWQAKVQLDDVRQADALFMTNSVIGIWPVKSFTMGKDVIHYRPNKIIKKLQKQVRAYS